MSQVSIEVNGRPYVIGCEDGQERRLLELASAVDAQVRQVSRDVGPLGETRLMLMCALVMADELAELRGQLEGLQGRLAEAQAARGRAELAAVSALDGAAARIERLAAA
ncbi:MAG TPA: cell division protein ZapA [Caulobacteraceae bacterium]|nr:cell division protein ZapA [Caulobacteraceae bacterium]